ncbi:unnamed protein product, partial [Mesorhabditis spiculigera]
MEPDVGDELHESSPCIIVKQALAFMLTTTFAHPGDMTVDHAEELINISLIYQPIRRNALVTAIERHLFGQLDKAKDNLPLLLQYFLLGYKWRLERLPTACSTLIFMHHQGDYVANYAHATATTPISRTHQELLDQLHAPRNPFRMAPHSKLVELFPYAQPCATACSVSSSSTTSSATGNKPTSRKKRPRSLKVSRSAADRMSKALRESDGPKSPKPEGASSANVSTCSLPPPDAPATPAGSGSGLENLPPPTMDGFKPPTDAPPPSANPSSGNSSPAL